MAKKDTSSHKGTSSSKSPIKFVKRNNHNHNISDEQKKELENLFYMDGITPMTASKLTGVTYRTAKRYFEMWAEELVRDPEHETWVCKQKRVRARALEGLTKKIIFATQQRSILERISANLSHNKNKKGEIVLKDIDEIPHGVLLGYNSKITELTNQFIILQNEYDAIDSAPPADIILKEELLSLSNEI